MAPTTLQRACCAAFAPLPAHVVGNAFILQYYDVLHRTPEEAHKFYHEDSRLVRPSASVNGARDCVTTIEAIQAKMTETCAGITRVEIMTVDSHHSHGGGVSVLVTGTVAFAGDASPRAFVQSFFLAPQGPNQYYVRNDTLRYVTASGGAAATASPNSPAVAAAAVDGKKGRKSPGSEPSAAMTSKVIAAAAAENHGDKTEEHSRHKEEAEDAVGSNRLGMLGKLRRLFLSPASVSDEPQDVPTKNEPQALPIKDEPEPEENGFLVIN